MLHTDFSRLDLNRLPTPCYVVDEVAIKRNLIILNGLIDQSGVKILAALKAFSCYELAPLISQYLTGTCASGLFEAKLAQDYFRGEIHVYAPAFKQSELAQLVKFADHIVLNSCSQLTRFQSLLKQAKIQRPELSYGLRINPEYSEIDISLYDPCAAGSRLGIPHSQLKNFDLEMIEGFHFHSLCEQGFKTLQRTLYKVEQNFGHLFNQLKWINLGGGHHLTVPAYELDALTELIIDFSQRHQLQVYMEPGEAIAIGTGILCCEVLDITYNQMNIAIVDTSATCHMPDTLEMPYQADISGAKKGQHNGYTYRIGGLTCLAGDVMGDYTFEQPLQIGQRLLFEDMSHYTMVKTTTFNGTRLPAIAVWNSETDHLRIVKHFDYSEFTARL